MATFFVLKLAKPYFIEKFIPQNSHHETKKVQIFCKKVVIINLKKNVYFLPKIYNNWSVVTSEFISFTQWLVIG